ncbi:A-kinase anchor protein 8-like isoform X1 [Hemiscyllium ocellatum]|uniref:A-kinase anchor protein 8-like isoform X1 n=1 Tax=Hemiscyllium ocellatum TaxID=170820 RepID=UPI002966677C|nr:A-kinase anchor protein 8-like isoform X1 [Hemiscyllium ocellatum]
MDSWYSGYGTGDSWNTGATNSQEYDGYDYSYTQDTIPSSATNYGYNSGNKSWEVPKNTATDTIIAKINKRLDMLSQLETENQVQDSYQDNRFTPYESYDSGSSLNDRDLYRSGYGYSEYGPDYNDSYGGRYDHYDSSYGTRRDQFQNRARDPYGPANQWGQNWSRDRPPYNRPNRNDPFMSPASSGRMSARWNELSMGGRGPNAATASSTRNLPSLFSPNIIPMDLFRVQGSGRPLGGARQRRRDRTRTRGMKKVTAGFGRKRKLSTASTDEPENKQAKSEDPNGSDPGEDDGGESGDAAGDAAGDGGTGEGKEGEDKKPKRFPTMQEKKKANKPKKNRDRLAERIMYACSVCKFRTFEDEDISSHVDSKFHKETFKFIATRLDKQTADFLHEYILNKIQKTQKRREQIGDKTILRKQLMQQQDLLQDVGLEHFMKKVEAAHCVACDLFIPIQNAVLMRHLKSPDHGWNRRAMLEKAKKGSLVVARSVLNNRNIAAMLEKYKKGENPFTDDPDKDEEDVADATAEGGDVTKDSSVDVENKGDTEDTGDNIVTELKQEMIDPSEENAGEATEEETGEGEGEAEEEAGGEEEAGEEAEAAVEEREEAEAEGEAGTEMFSGEAAEDKDPELTAEEEDEMLKGDEEQLE